MKDLMRVLGEGIDLEGSDRAVSVSLGFASDELTERALQRRAAVIAATFTRYGPSAGEVSIHSHQGEAGELRLVVERVEP